MFATPSSNVRHKVWLVRMARQATTCQATTRMKSGTCLIDKKRVTHWLNYLFNLWGVCRTASGFASVCLICIIDLEYLTLTLKAVTQISNIGNKERSLEISFSSRIETVTPRIRRNNKPLGTNWQQENPNKTFFAHLTAATLMLPLRPKWPGRLKTEDFVPDIYW